MNNVILIGRLTKDPEIRYTKEGMAVASFNIAVDRHLKQNGEKQTDFPRITCFGKTAELVERYVSKGRQLAVQGRIQTGSYRDNDGKMVYTTDVVAEKVEFLGSSVKERKQSETEGDNSKNEDSEFDSLDDCDIPF